MQEIRLTDWLNGPKEAVLLDVRETDEFCQGHVPGARNLPLSAIASWKESLSPQQPYAVMCQMGSRAQMAVERLAEEGFQQLLLVRGGFGTYQGPVEKGDGHE
ncbi:rhodanese-like domain-containing protein [Streptococcus sp. DD12]|uniref:rhodanese-like domain-containing protein n=1 Tax=Streptococcus sp. DD12 TaxID=1777880 RepID=UPI000798F0C7|nr:rhodanese-like domain-containing protein [Streptococcus sp. DD12]KXT75778.1 Rhodanese-like domain protein [Streptococcus sp. DD12]